MEETVSYLLQHVKQVIVLGPTMEYSPILPKILAATATTNTSQLEFAASKHYNSSKFKLSNKIGRTLANNKADYVPIIPTLCPEDRCTVISDKGEPMAFDYGHFTFSGAKTIVDRLITNGQLILR